MKWNPYFSTRIWSWLLYRELLSLLCLRILVCDVMWVSLLVGLVRVTALIINSCETWNDAYWKEEWNNRCIICFGIITGNPSPLVLWYMDDRLIDSSYHVENENQVINHISLPNIQRSQHRASLECRARNTVLISPVSKTVSIELNCKLILNTIWKIFCKCTYTYSHTSCIYI